MLPVDYMNYMYSMFWVNDGWPNQPGKIMLSYYGRIHAKRLDNFLI